ncbi:recombinase family protein [Mesorhizobium australicum]|uniref:recombinase family protein n=1 Tax=Mesorhizobium australicum TaxID=536018 RepID=UPI003334C663
MKVALGARYSTDNHRDASIEDQLRLCCLRAEKQGWTVVHSNTHRAICGASLLRPGLQELISDPMQGNSVLAEAMDRLTMTAANREQARLGKRCNRSFKEIHRLLATPARCEW